VERAGTILPNIFGLCSVAIIGILKRFATLRARVDASITPSCPYVLVAKIY